MNRIFIATSTFAVHSNKSTELLEESEYVIKYNPLLQKIKKNELISLAKDAQCIIAGTETYTRHVLEQLPQLKVISRLGVGMDNIDLKAAEERGIKVFKTSTTPAPAVAELVLGLMIDVNRHISKCNQSLRNGTWKKEMGSLLQGKTLGIIGLGTIGKALVNVSKGIQFNILAFDQHNDESFAKENDVTYCDLETLLKSADIISIHLNLTDQTKSLFDQEKIALMKPEAILINTSRGEIIDEDALHKALKDNRLAGAGLDVFEHEPYNGPLTELDNVVLTPHIGAYAKEIRIKMEMEAAKNLIRGLNDA